MKIINVTRLVTNYNEGPTIISRNTRTTAILRILRIKTTGNKDVEYIFNKIEYPLNDATYWHLFIQRSDVV